MKWERKRDIREMMGKKSGTPPVTFGNEERWEKPGKNLDPSGTPETFTKRRGDRWGKKRGPDKDAKKKNKGGARNIRAKTDRVGAG